MIDIDEIPNKPQRNDSVLDQIADLIMVANRLGMYDAADAINQLIKNIPKLRYGCHCDLEPGMEPDGCVIDEGNPQDCVYAVQAGRKENCKYWKIISGMEK